MARLRREVRWANSIGGSLSVVLLSVPDASSSAGWEPRLDTIVRWLNSAHPGALAIGWFRAGGAQIGVLLPGAGLSRAQEFCQWLRRPPTSIAGIGDYLVEAVQGLASWEPGITVTDLLARAEQALQAGLQSGAQQRQVLFHHAMERNEKELAIAWDDWSV